MMQWHRDICFGYDLGWVWVDPADGVQCGGVTRRVRGWWFQRLGYRWTSGNPQYGGGSGWCWTAARARRAVEESQRSRRWHEHVIEWNPFRPYNFGSR